MSLPGISLRQIGLRKEIDKSVSISSISQAILLPMYLIEYILLDIPLNIHQTELSITDYYICVIAVTLTVTMLSFFGKRGNGRAVMQYTILSYKEG